MRLNKQFFQKYQKLILWLANSFIGKYFFQFEKMGHKLRKEKIDRITPNSIRYKNKGSYTEQFFGRNEYALKLAPLVWWLPIELWEHGIDGKKGILRPIYQLVLIALILKLPKGLPLLGLTVTDFDADSGLGGIDGNAYRSTVTENWADIRANAGNGHADSASTIYTSRLTADSTQDLWIVNYRTFFIFDTSALTSGATISGADFKTVNSFADQQTLAGSFYLSLVGSTPASNTAMENSDYADLGSTKYASDSAFGVASGATRTMALNGTGLAAISKTSYTKLGMNFSGDIDNSEPTWSNGDYIWTKCYTAINGSNKPTLTVTYTVAATDTGNFFQLF